jgi:NhaP-type Na+/H+ or K+/H+ antiporter
VSYLISITIIGLAALAMSWMPSVSKISRVSYSIFYVIFGAALYLSLKEYLPVPDPVTENYFTVHFTELVVIISLMGTGLKIDQKFSVKNWKVPFRLVSITMILSIAIVACIGVFFLNFDLASSVLLGAVLAPTDPVLASDVQVGPPMETKQDKVKFSLTAEAGMNDGTAFPFTWLAIALAFGATQADLLDWLWRDVGYRIIAGVLIGYVTGRVLCHFVFTLPDQNNQIKVRDGFVAISATLLVYGLTEMLNGYGFMAVFICAITLRNYELGHKYHKRLHDFTDQIERLLIGIVLLLFGGSLVNGILDGLNWQMIVFAVLFIFIIRPLTALLAMYRTTLHFKEKIAVSFFGIRGMGSFFYLAFALGQAKFITEKELWAVCSFVVLLSIVVHGLTANIVMTKLESEFAREVDRKVESVPETTAH